MGWLERAVAKLLSGHVGLFSLMAGPRPPSSVPREAVGRRLRSELSEEKLRLNHLVVPGTWYDAVVASNSGAVSPVARHVFNLQELSFLICRMGSLMPPPCRSTAKGDAGALGSQSRRDRS